MSEWQDISTAPRDGTAILVTVYDGKMAVVRYINRHWTMYHMRRDNAFMNWLRGPQQWLALGIEPKFWQPLPHLPINH